MDEKIIEAKFSSLEARIVKLEEALLANSVVVNRGGKKSSPKEFLMTKTAKADTKKVLALGYYLEHLSGMESFNVVDLEAIFRAAKEKLPTNMNDAVNKNITQGFLMEAADKKDYKKAWCLTSTGERFVENELNK